LLDYPLIASPSTLARLEERQHILGRRFPAAVREWYALDRAVAILETYGNSDRPIPLARLGEIEKGYGGNPDQDLLTNGLLLIMYENQGVTRWAIRLDGTDDPPVLVQEDWPRGPWHIYAGQFSTFVYTRVWDWQTALVTSRIVGKSGKEVDGNGHRVVLV